MSPASHLALTALPVTKRALLNSLKKRGDLSADDLAPRAYAEITNELLEYVEDADPDLLEAIFDKRRRRRIERAHTRLANKPFPQQVEELAKILDEDGYLADCTRLDDITWLVTEHNCAIFGVAMRYGQACSSEIEFIRAVMSGAHVERISHMVAGSITAATASLSLAPP